jgi:hypothetical protein
MHMHTPKACVNNIISLVKLSLMHALSVQRHGHVIAWHQNRRHVRSVAHIEYFLTLKSC